MKLARAPVGQSATSPWRANVALTHLLQADGAMTTRLSARGVKQEPVSWMLECRRLRRSGPATAICWR